MPLLYGEGHRAFLRLQEEIMKYSDDHSLFVWRMDSPPELHGLLADSPKAFAKSGAVFPYTNWMNRKPYGISNRGLSIELPLTQSNGSRLLFEAALQCPPPNGSGGYSTVTLKKIEGTENQYARTSCDRIGKIEQLGVATSVYIPQGVALRQHVAAFGDHYFSLRNLIHDGGPLERERLFRMISSLHPRLASGASIAMPESEANVFSWVDGMAPPVTVFKIVKLPNKLTAALVLSSRVRQHEKVAILLGSSSLSRFEVGFDVCKVSYVDSSKAPKWLDYESIFRPRPMGICMKLANLRLTVNSYQKVDKARTIYLIDVVVKTLHEAPAVNQDVGLHTCTGLWMTKGTSMESG